MNRANVRPGRWLCLTLLVTMGLTPTLAAAPTQAQRAQARLAETAIKKAGNLYRAKKLGEARQAIDEAQQSLDKLTADDSPELKALAAPLVKQIARARELLDASPGTPAVKVPAAKTAPARGAKATKGGTQAPDAPTVSFTKQVAPLLVAKCGGCHVQRARGDFSMASYVALSKGTPAGTVIMAGDAQGSRLMEVIESGDMPRGGGQVSPTERATLAAWIEGGAKFDGPDSAAPLASFVTGTPGAPAMAEGLQVVPASAKDEVQFARDVGPLLLANCIECHGDQNPRNNFSVSNFQRLLRGGDAGVVLAPGKGAESLLIKKLRGTASGPQMPQGRDPLPEEQIAKIEKWIDLGAKFDGETATMPLEDLVAQIRAAGLTHEQLSQERVELAARRWRLILPDTTGRGEESPNVLVYGNVGPEILADVAHVADEQIAKIRKALKIPSDTPLIKGRLTIYVFEKRYDYGEVGTMLEQREIPAIWRGHWSFNPLDAYACVLLSDTGEAAPGLVAQQVTGAYLASLGKVPRWFAEGTARALAARLDPKDPRVKLWEDSVGRILGATDKPENFLTGEMAPEDADILSYSYAKSLLGTSRQHAVLMSALRESAPVDAAQFEKAFVKAYGGTPAQLVTSWSARAAKRGR